MSSRIPGFYEESLERRLEVVASRCSISEDAYQTLKMSKDQKLIESLSENVIGSISFPLSVATNFVIDGEDILVPMAIEESSVVAAASHGAKLARETGGFSTSVSDPYMIGQIQLQNISDPYNARSRILKRSDEILSKANDQGVLVSHGGGCEDVTARIINTPQKEMVIVHLIVNVQDSMGANAVNTMVESVAPLVEKITSGNSVFRILSNLADQRVVRAYCTIPVQALERKGSSFSGEEIRDRIVSGWAFAAGDPYRATTHNKGILNAMDALAAATMNDWRAIEAGAHGFASHDEYSPLTTYEINADGDLSCCIEIPVQMGTVGGATRVHPTADAAMEILDIESSNELAGIFGAVGLAENIASMRALSDEGIQSGHMKLHAKNVAREANASESLVDQVATQMVAEDNIRVGRARELVKEFSS